MELVYQYMAIFFNFSPSSSHLYPLQVENCDSNSRLVVDEDDNGKVRLERVNMSNCQYRQLIGKKCSLKHISAQRFFGGDDKLDLLKPSYLVLG